ncbi:unknown protein [Simkania negevensis Z]|uniref:Uncharacterized protein n=1 Tax=Simkania negevensis (strain ATCC VR-1471 / DSM 27360 / Z) TaxID=331113 RepID=F8L5R6_SIMNZ|nr:unknown protein [Simkania negevensis Z]
MMRGGESTKIDFFNTVIAEGKIDLSQLAIDGSFSPSTWWGERS